MSRRPISLSSSSGGDSPRRSKIAEGFLLVLRALLFLVQFVVFAVGFLLYQLGRGLISFSRLRDDPSDDSSSSGSPPSSPNQSSDR